MVAAGSKIYNKLRKPGAAGSKIYNKLRNQGLQVLKYIIKGLFIDLYKVYTEKKILKS